MKNLQYYLNEHDVLLGLAHKLKGNLHSPRPDHRLLEVQLYTLKSGITIHVITEDQDLYPRLSRCGIPALEQRTRELLAKSAGIEHRFDAMENHWHRHRSFQNYPNLARELDEIVNVLEERISEENRLIELARRHGLVGVLDSENPANGEGSRPPVNPS